MAYIRRQRAWALARALRNLNSYTHATHPNSPAKNPYLSSASSHAPDSSVQQENFADSDLALAGVVNADPQDSHSSSGDLSGSGVDIEGSDSIIGGEPGERLTRAPEAGSVCVAPY